MKQRSRVKSHCAFLRERERESKTIMLRFMVLFWSGIHKGWRACALKSLTKYNLAATHYLTSPGWCRVGV